MSRLYDRIMRYSDLTEYFPQIINSPVIQISDVLHYWFDSAINKSKSWSAKDYPCILPPFDVCFLEADLPGYLMNTSLMGNNRHLGWMVEKKTIQQEIDGIPVEALIKSRLFSQESKNDKAIGILPYVTEVWMDKQGKIVSDFRIGIDLSYIKDRQKRKQLEVAEEKYLEDVKKNDHEQLDLLTRQFESHLHPCLLAISFMHCKNVTLQQVLPPAKLSKKYQKKHGKPLTRYHVLDIEPMKKVLRTEGRIEETGLKKALHICRGHFKDYRNSGGLFGKYKEMYWWESHVRGDVSEGIVTKDYNIKL